MGSLGRAPGAKEDLIPGNDEIKDAAAPKILVVGPEAEDGGPVGRFPEIAAEWGRNGAVAACEAVGDMAGLVSAIERHRPGFVFCSFFKFPGMGGGYVEDAAEEAGAAWIGSSSSTMELALSKPRMKAFLRERGIPTPPWFSVRRTDNGAFEGLDEVSCATGFPYIVKPAGEGNSRGIDRDSVVHDGRRLEERARAVAERYGEALVERYVAGGDGSREFTVALMGNGPRAIVAPAEIVKRAGCGPVVGESDKESDAAGALPLEEGRLREEVSSLAREVFRATEARDYARCDILLHEGRLYVIEMNGQPLLPDSWFAACSRGAGIDGLGYIDAIAIAALARLGRRGDAIPARMSEALPFSAYKRLTA